MGQRFDFRGMHCKVWVKEMGEMDAVGLGCKAQEIGIGIETPGQAVLFEGDRFFIFPEEQPLGHIAIAQAVGSGHGGAAVPIDGNDGDRLIGDDASDDAAGCDLFKCGHV